MRFEERELKPYPEPVSVDELREGSIYFAVNFIDEELLVPTMEPLIFVGRNLDPDDVEKYYFQDVDSYRDGVRYATAVPEEDGATFYSGAPPNHIFDYEHALDCLLACALRRRGVLGR